MVSLKTFSKSPSLFAFRIEFIPRSERAKLIDLVKFSGVVVGSLRSVMWSEASTNE